MSTKNKTKRLYMRVSPKFMEAIRLIKKNPNYKGYTTSKIIDSLLAEKMYQYGQHKLTNEILRGSNYD